MSAEEPDLEEALDGVIAATKYAEEIGEDEISRKLGRIYQELGKAAPEDHWDQPTEPEFNFGFGHQR